MKRLINLVLVIMCLILLSGCWNYRGLNDIDIVTGIAVDRDGSDGLYTLTFEIVDTQASGEEGGQAALYVEAQGETLFDAIRNSKKKLINKLYGGNMQTLIISRQIAQSEGISAILEELLRDGEPRETMSVVISQEETAKELLLSKGIDSKIISYQIHEMIEEDSRVTASTVSVPLYKAYNLVKGTGNVLVLPAMRCVKNGEDTVVEGNGIAVFRGDLLIGFLTPQQTKLYLFIIDEIKGGVLSFALKNPNESISMEIKSSCSKTKINFLDGQLTINLSVNVKLNVMETKSQVNLSQVGQREELRRLTEHYLEESILNFFHEMQKNYKRDIWGLGRLLYQEDPALWRSVEAEWNGIIENAVINITAQADILSSGVLKDY